MDSEIGMLCDPGSGSAHAIFGPMCSAKTDQLLAVLEKFERCAKVDTVLLKPKRNTREKDVCSRRGVSRAPTAIVENGKDAWAFLESRASSLVIHAENAATTFMVGIDEAHFLPDLLYFVLKALGNERSEIMKNKTVIVYLAALDSTFEQQQWPEIIPVVPFLNTYRKSLAICGCCQSREAGLSRRDSPETDLVVLGDTDKYTPSCYKCLSHRCYYCISTKPQ